MTKIEWTDKTWSPVTGCTKISPGCKNCYAERMAKRLAGRNGYPEAPEHFRLTQHPERLKIPFKWRKPRMVFTASMSDLFHKEVTVKFLDQIFAMMALLHQHTFQVLTKRPERALRYFNRIDSSVYMRLAALPLANENGIDWDYRMRKPNISFPLKNVWLGVSAENQEQADKRIPILLQIPAAVRFISVEPMLGPLYLGKCGAVGMYRPGYKDGEPVNFVSDPNFPRIEARPLIDWVICGGESGPRARPMHPDWVTSIRDQCQDAGIPFFFKQWGRYMPSFGSSSEPSVESVTPFGKDGGHMIIDQYGKWPEPHGRLLYGREWNEMPG